MWGKKDISNLTDEELLAEFRKSKDKQYIGLLFKRYSHLVFGVCMKYLKNGQEAEDAVMEIFEALPDKLLKYDIQYLKSWLHSVARNHCLMDLRKRKSEGVTVDVDESPHLVVESGDPLHPNEEEEKEIMLTKLEEAIASLGEEQQKCIRLFFLEQRCYQDVADITGYSLKKVKSYIQNGKRNLKIQLIRSDE